MTHALDATMVFNGAAAVLYMLLGVWILTLTPRRRQTTLLAGFAITFGLAFLTSELLHLVLGIPNPPQAADNLVGSAASLFAIGLAWAVPEPLEDRRFLVIAAVVGGVFSTLIALSIHGGVPPTPVSNPLAAVGIVVGFGGLYAASLLLALRARPSRGAGRARTAQWALLSVAFAVIFGFLSGGELRDVAQAVVGGSPGEALLEGANFLAWFAVAGVWGRNMLEADGSEVRLHRNAAVAILGVVVAGAVYFSAVPGAGVQDTVMRGVMHALGVGLLAYGVLRHDLAGLDEKVRFGVSRTTVAGVFVAVFFVAGELAETFFGEVFGPYAGVVAAGALVFAISPLQRLADRFAARAVPGGAPPGPPSAGGDEAEETYRVAVAKFLADGELSAEDQRHLGRLATRLGIDAERAAEIRVEVEQEQGAGGDAP